MSGRGAPHGTAVRMAGQPPGPGSFSVPSISHPGRVWPVEWITSGTRWCGCPRFAREQTCRHVEVVEDAIRDEVRMLAVAQTPERRAEAARRLQQIEEMFSR